MRFLRPSRKFKNGARVCIAPHWSWPEGGKGYIASTSVVKTLQGKVRQYFVWFDKELSDGTEFGPYAAGTVDEQYLTNVDADKKVD